jgi:hypothetical protein
MKHVLLPCQLKIQVSPRSRPKFTQWDHRPWQFHPQQSTHTNSTTRKLVQSSFDDEFRSSQQIALGLHQRYKSVLEGGFTNNLREFINAGVTAYAVGCTDEGLRKELLNVGQAGVELDGSTGAGAGANVVLKSKIRAEEVVVM